MQVVFEFLFKYLIRNDLQMLGPQRKSLVIKELTPLSVPEEVSLREGPLG